MRIIEPPKAVKIMAIAAHPDDIESWCAGTLACAVDAGATIHLLLVTSGEHGSSDLLADPRLVATVREQEAQIAAECLGIKEVTFLRYPDGEVEETHQLRGELVKWIRRWQPDLVFTHDPTHYLPAYLCHRDHRVVGRAALDAVYPLARDHLAFAEQIQAGLKSHAVGQVWLFASSQAEAYVNIEPGFERKIEARLAHKSQTPDPEALVAAWRTRATIIGEKASLLLAEAFTVLEID